MITNERERERERDEKCGFSCKKCSVVENRLIFV